MNNKLMMRTDMFGMIAILITNFYMALYQYQSGKPELLVLSGLFWLVVSGMMFYESHNHMKKVIEHHKEHHND